VALENQQNRDAAQGVDAHDVRENSVFSGHDDSLAFGVRALRGQRVHRRGAQFGAACVAAPRMASMRMERRDIFFPRTKKLRLTIWIDEFIKSFS
jgi:hypothetical protein